MIRYYDFMCSPHVTVLCLCAHQCDDMTAPLDCLKHKSLISITVETGGDRKNKAEPKIRVKGRTSMMDE